MCTGRRCARQLSRAQELLSGWQLETECGRRHAVWLRTSAGAVLNWCKIYEAKCNCRCACQPCTVPSCRATVTSLVCARESICSRAQSFHLQLDRSETLICRAWNNAWIIVAMIQVCSPSIAIALNSKSDVATKQGKQCLHRSSSESAHTKSRTWPLFQARSSTLSEVDLRSCRRSMHASYEGCTSCRTHLFQNSNLQSATTMLTCLHRLCCSSTRFRLEIETKVEQVQSWSAFCGLWPCVGCALHSSRHPDGVCALCNVLPAFLHHWTPASSHMTAEGIVSEVKSFKALPRKVDKAFLMNPEAQFCGAGIAVKQVFATIQLLRTAHSIRYSQQETASCLQVANSDAKNAPEYQDSWQNMSTADYNYHRLQNTTCTGACICKVDRKLHLMHDNKDRRDSPFCWHA